MRRQRNYHAEYERRVARGIARGLSRSQARGHPGVAQPFASRRTARLAYDDVLEEGVRRMREGHSLTFAAAAVGVPRERLRRYVEQMGIGQRERRRWAIGPDRRPRYVPIYSEGREIEVLVAGYAEAAEAGRFSAAVSRFQATNDPLVLAPFAGAGVRDIRGHFHPYETRPNELYRLMLAGPLPYEQVYRIVA